MTRMRTILAILTVAAGCTQEQALVPTADLGGSDSDFSGPTVLERFDLAAGDLAVKRGWTQIFAASGLRLNAVWGSGAGDVYAVGLQGTIFHSSGDDVWTEQKTGRLLELTSVYGSSASDVYAVESESVLHTSGDRHWSVASSIQPDGGGSLRRAFLTSPTNVYFAGGTGQSVPAYPTGGTNIMRWNQRTLSREYAAAQHSVSGLWGSDASDLWAVGSYEQGGGTLALVLHSTGDGSWTQQTFQPEKGILYLGSLTAVWSSGKSNVYAAAGFGRSGGQSGIFRCSGPGTDWRPETDKANSPKIYGLWGSGPMDVWAVGSIQQGSHYNGVVLRSKGDGNWTPDPDLPAAKLVDLPLEAVWGSRFGDVYIVGQGGVILHKRE